MSESPETVVVDPCPNCKTEGGHTYIVPVERHFILALMAKPPEIITRSFRVAFQCPINIKPFAVTLRLKESALDRILAVGDPTLKPQEEEEEEEEVDE